MDDLYLELKRTLVTCCFSPTQDCVRRRAIWRVLRIKTQDCEGERINTQSQLAQKWSISAHFACFRRYLAFGDFVNH
jgi:hypothetical protein